MLARVHGAATPTSTVDAFHGLLVDYCRDHAIAGDREGPARGQRLRLRAADGADEPPAHRRRDACSCRPARLHLPVLEPGQGGRDVRRRRVRARPRRRAAPADHGSRGPARPTRRQHRTASSPTLAGPTRPVDVHESSTSSSRLVEEARVDADVGLLHRQPRPSCSSCWTSCASCCPSSSPTPTAARRPRGHRRGRPPRGPADHRPGAERRARPAGLARPRCAAPRSSEAERSAAEAAEQAHAGCGRRSTTTSTPSSPTSRSPSTRRSPPSSRAARRSRPRRRRRRPRRGAAATRSAVRARSRERARRGRGRPGIRALHRGPSGSTSRLVQPVPPCTSGRAHLHQRKRSVTTLDPRPPLVLDVRELGRRAGAMARWSWSYRRRWGSAPWACPCPRAATSTLDLRLESVVEGVLVSGTASAQVRGECSRCLDPSPTR